MRTSALRCLPALLLALAAACGDGARVEPTAPIAPPSLALDPTYLCVNNPTGQDIQRDIGDLLSGTPRQTAQAQFNDVQRNCTSNLPLAQSQMLLVVQTLLDALPASLRAGWLPTSEEAITLARVLNNLFLYVGYDAPPVLPTTVVSTGAIVLAVDATVATDVVTGDGNAILRVPANATTGTRLYTITPIGENCLSTNLEQLGTCYDMDVSPYVTPFAIPLTVGICQTRDLAQVIDPRRRIAHESDPANFVTEVLPLVTIPPVAGFCEEPASSMAPLPGDAGALQRAWYAARRLAGAVGRAVGPKTAYALHGGLGGSTPTLSPFNTVNRDVFQASFDNNALGLLTTATLPERGRWVTASYKNPGSITVIAEPGAPTNNLAVLDQGGGACTTNCGSLLLRGQIDGTYLQSERANEGVYLASLTLAQQKPVVKAGPFSFLDSDQREIARLEYRTTNAGRQLLFNGQVVGTWNVGVKQTFTVVINYADVPFNQDAFAKTRVVIRTGGQDSCPVGPEADGWWRFQNRNADDLRFFEANFTRIDAGIFYLDAVRIFREDDPQQLVARPCGLLP